MNTQYNQEREDLAAAFRWTARLNMHEAIANHFSLAVNESGSQVPFEPNWHAFFRDLCERLNSN
jgi:ribulose-5-phosphate 4-epimerase/fuculose-1-phosphate aldolase